MLYETKFLLDKNSIFNTVSFIPMEEKIHQHLQSIDFFIK